MSKAKRGGRVLGRGLEPYEVALIKSMRQRGLTRDFIMSLILRPGRVLTPAAVSEVIKGKIGPEISPATREETDRYIDRRIASSAVDKTNIGGPTSQSVVLDLIRAAVLSEANSIAMESRALEFKEIAPSDKAGRCAIARTISGFANAGGGYVIFGINDARQVIGLDEPAEFPRVCDQIGDALTEHFSPAIEWDKAVIDYEGKSLGVIYAHVATRKPVIAMRDGADISKSAIYYRYEGKTQRIEPGDLFELLNERDRLAAARAKPEKS